MDIKKIQVPLSLPHLLVEMVEACTRCLVSSKQQIISAPCIVEANVLWFPLPPVCLSSSHYSLSGAKQARSWNNWKLILHSQKESKSKLTTINPPVHDMIIETVTAKYASTECSKYLVQNFFLSFFSFFFFWCKIGRAKCLFWYNDGKNIISLSFSPNQFTLNRA